MAVNEYTIYLGGWYGDDGVSTPTYEPFWDGWVDIGDQSELEDRVENIENFLLSHRFIEIGPDGQYQEVAFTL